LNNQPGQALPARGDICTVILRCNQGVPVPGGWAVTGSAVSVKVGVAGGSRLRVAVAVGEGVSGGAGAPPGVAVIGKAVAVLVGVTTG
jgi:hypothetical protein